MKENRRKNSIPTDAITRSVVELAADTGNIYESVMVITKRANQISGQRREQLKAELEQFSRIPDTLEEVYQDQEQIEVSRRFETLPKSTIVATEEFLNGKLYYRHAATQEHFDKKEK